MHIQLIILSLLVSATAWAQPTQKEVESLFAKYEQVIDGKKVALSEVFTKDFIESVGGEKSLRSGWEKEKKAKVELQITPARLDKNMAFVKRIPAGTKEHSHSSFIVKKIDGKWLIEGTMTDDND